LVVISFEVLLLLFVGGRRTLGADIRIAVFRFRVVAGTFPNYRERIARLRANLPVRDGYPVARIRFFPGDPGIKMYAIQRFTT
jgi:hypothetical protein